MEKVGVIGAGVMGRGVAQNLAQSGVNTVLVDLSEEILEAAKEEIYNSVRLQSLFKKAEVTESPQEVLGKIFFTTDITLLNDASFAIENITEDWGKKEKVHKMLNSICPENCNILVNTSCISITRVAAVYNHPERVIGTHFMNPVPLKTAVEVIRGYHTSEQTIQETECLLKKMGKESIVINDYPGFVSNRISHLMMNEAAFIVQDGIAAPEEIDEIFKKCYGHKMGPLETADLIGLDTVVKSLKVLYESYQDSKFRCCPLLRKMTDAGLHGKKSGKGFYEY
ncbi:3-hydroxyacyl-CoA dehydrogenase family protein [Marinisporobacter balticus]|uniref:3-hydroxybutyryl-CoA dehydrogenase n=1 Tax=Marinisporobacter balticus TaxID=2018667 RepID=A0A4R2KUK2_9FIRM|nr:3-hydroxyacyl-CoA dehydrogenase NAD-binding domain-containing protein [Marinisporobacter balticus]TCO70405.1 3-hydroxybutyryl-CoA dehydrogenase [Marinisporobacter balticus]